MELRFTDNLLAMVSITLATMVVLGIMIDSPLTAAEGPRNGFQQNEQNVSETHFTFTKRGKLISRPPGMPKPGPYYPTLVKMEEVRHFPHDYALYFSTDHDRGKGGIWLYVCNGNPTDASHWKSYDQAVADGDFDYLKDKPNANPIFIDTIQGTQTETPHANVIDHTVFMTYHNAGAGHSQSTLLATSQDGVNFSRINGDKDSVILDYEPEKDAGNGHTGYFRWRPNPFSGLDARYVGYSLHGGGDNFYDAIWVSNNAIHWDKVQVFDAIEGHAVEGNRIVRRHGMDVNSITPLGNGEYVAIGSIGNRSSGGRARVLELYEVFLSDDGKKLTRESRKILPNGPSGAYDEEELDGATSVMIGNTWHLLYVGTQGKAGVNTIMGATGTLNLAAPKSVKLKPEDQTRDFHRERSINIGRETQLFVDDVLIAHKEGVVRNVHACQKLDHPVLRATQPWERTDIDRRLYVYGTALPKEKGPGYRLWYGASGERLLYATSSDGIHWDRPNLGFVEYAGSKANNLLNFSIESPSIVRDPEPEDLSKRYKMFGRASGSKRGYYAAFSADGLHWRSYERNPVLTGGDTCTLAYDPESKEFLAFHKRSHDYRGATRRRLVYLAASKDMQTWSEPELVMAPDAIDDRQTQSQGGKFSHFYNMSAFRYGSQWLGLVTHFRHMGPPSEKGPSQSGQDGPIDVQLVHSRDGRNWQRCDDRSPVIGNGPHAYDAGCILGVTNHPIVTDDEVWIYYSAITTTHGGYLPKKEISIARAAWRLDGWCSLRADETEGVVETVSLRPEGDQLWINADALRGRIVVAVLDIDGNPLPDYNAAHCIPLKGSNVRQAVRWINRGHLPGHHPIRLRFHILKADLFSYRVE